MPKHFGEIVAVILVLLALAYVSVRYEDVARKKILDAIRRHKRNNEK